MEDRSLLQKIRKIYQVEDELDEAEKKKVAALIRNIFRYMDKHAKDIMTHRTDIGGLFLFHRLFLSEKGFRSLFPVLARPF